MRSSLIDRRASRLAHARSSGPSRGARPRLAQMREGGRRIDPPQTHLFQSEIIGSERDAFWRGGGTHRFSTGGPRADAEKLRFRRQKLGDSGLRGRLFSFEVPSTPKIDIATFPPRSWNLIPTMRVSMLRGAHSFNLLKTEQRGRFQSNEDGVQEQRSSGCLFRITTDQKGGFRDRRPAFSRTVPQEPLPKILWRNSIGMRGVVTLLLPAIVFV